LRPQRPVIAVPAMNEALKPLKRLELEADRRRRGAETIPPRRAIARPKEGS
jgi:hypothetical protein